MELATLGRVNLSVLLANPTPLLFFTGKGGVGKTSLSTAAAIALADSGKRVLLVSTDAASNLDEMLGVPLRNRPVEVPGVPGLSVLNIDPSAAAEAYRERVLAKVGDDSSGKDKAVIREELSGACTTEIAAFDEFVAVITDDSSKFQHVVFDTAPTGHTLRLLSLPKAWTGFLEGNDRGASCLGPHSGLKTQEARFRVAMNTLTDPSRTTVVLVTLADRATVAEAARTASELSALGLTHQHLAINGVFHAGLLDDPVAVALEALGRQAIAELPPELSALPRDEVPLRPFDTVGLAALRALLSDGVPPLDASPPQGMSSVQAEPLSKLIDELEGAGHGLIMVMGKGGVGKTTIAAAVALQLVKRGHSVQLTTTDPAAHLVASLAGEVPGLQVSRIDPVAETQRYVEQIMTTKGRDLDEQGKALLREDLRSPCTEEVAVFHAFSRVMSEARRTFVVLDTAPTGHSLLLIDATGAYHRQTLRDLPSSINPRRISTPLMRLQDSSLTRVVIVTLPETTPVSQAAALQEDLRRAHIEPFAWVVNRSLLTSGTRDPVLAARLAGERLQFARISNGLGKRVFVLPWVAVPPIGVAALDSFAKSSVMGNEVRTPSR